MVFICNHLLMLTAELKKAGDGGVLEAVKDLRKKLCRGLPYGELPYLPAVAQSGTRVQLCKVQRDGQVFPHSLMLYSLNHSLLLLEEPSSLSKMCQHCCTQPILIRADLCQCGSLHAVKEQC